MDEKMFSSCKNQQKGTAMEEEGMRVAKATNDAIETSKGEKENANGR